MKLNVSSESKSFRTEDQLLSSTGFAARQHSTYYQKRGKAPLANSPASLSPGPQTHWDPNALTATPIRRQKSEINSAGAIGGGIPWGLFAAFAAALASFGFLFVVASTGGIYLG